ncbi:glycosyltransferase family 4 protein [Vibrio splendidus]
MIYLDGMVFSLQRFGGISVYFSELIKLTPNEIKLDVNYFTDYEKNSVYSEYDLSKMKFSVNKSRLLERYLDVSCSDETEVFHSSYYRLPNRTSRKKVKVVTTVHDFTYERYMKGLGKFVHSQQKKRSLLNSDVIICISESTKKDLLYFFPQVSVKDIRVIHNGVSDDFHTNGSVQAVDKGYVIFVGARFGYKNFSEAVKSLSVHKDLKLKIIGGGLITNSEQELLDRYLPDRYEVLGFVSNKELCALYSSAFCLLYPSLYEGFGIPALEAMKSGCPVIASNDSSLPEVCGGAGYLLDRPDSKSISDAIFELKNTNLHEQLVQLGIRNSGKFTWKKCVSKINDIYLGQ